MVTLKLPQFRRVDRDKLLLKQYGLTKAERGEMFARGLAFTQFAIPNGHVRRRRAPGRTRSEPVPVGIPRPYCLLLTSLHRCIAMLMSRKRRKRNYQYRSTSNTSPSRLSTGLVMSLD